MFKKSLSITCALFLGVTAASAEMGFVTIDTAQIGITTPLTWCEMDPACDPLPMANIEAFANRAKDNAALIMYRSPNEGDASLQMKQLIADLNTHQEETIKVCIEQVKLAGGPDVTPPDGVEYVPCYGQEFLQSQVFNFDMGAGAVVPTIGLIDIAAGRGDRDLAAKFMAQSGFDKSVLGKLAAGTDFSAISKDITLTGDWRDVPVQVGTQIPEICTMIRCQPSLGLGDGGICEQCLGQSAAYFQPLMTPDLGPALATDLLKLYE